MNIHLLWHVNCLKYGTTINENENNAMKNLTITLSMALLMVGSVAANAEEVPTPIQQKSKLNSVVMDRIDDIHIAEFGKDEVEVTVHYTVNNEGVVKVTEVEGNDCFINSYVKAMIEGDAIFVTEELANQEHTVKVKYVNI